MPAHPPALPMVLASRRSRVFWPGLACGLMAAFGIQLSFVLILSVFVSPEATRVAPSGDGTGHMMCASLASLVGAAVSGLVTCKAQNPHAALNTYLAWACASAMLMINVAFTTNVLG